MSEMYSCHEHIDVVLDDFVDTYELAPEMELIQVPLHHLCTFCQQDAHYRLYQLEQA